jgi:hypothetical protein
LDLHESGIIGKPFKRTSTAMCFQYFIFDLEYMKKLQVLSRFMQNDSNLLLVRITVCIESCLLLAGALSFDEKIRQSTPLF